MNIPQLCRYHFILEARDNLDLPEYKGSTFRGGFGHAFRKVVCMMAREDCGDCGLKGRCIYKYVFETEPPEGTEKLRNLKDIPRPFVLEPPLESKQFYRPGEPLVFNLILIGKAIEYLSYFIYTIEHMGTVGIGFRKGRYRLREVRASDGGGLIFSDGRLHTDNPVAIAEAALTERAGKLASGATAIIRFETPTRIVSDDSLQATPDFSHLVRSLLRRLGNLLQFHCSMEPDWDFRELIESAEGVRTNSAGLEWSDRERYSNRQQKRVPFGGMVGTMVCHGALAPFALPLVLGEYVHVGKNTTFGFGKYSIMM